MAKKSIGESIVLAKNAMNTVTVEQFELSAPKPSIDQTLIYLILVSESWKYASGIEPI